MRQQDKKNLVFRHIFFSGFMYYWMALNRLRLLYDVFLSLFGNTGLTPLDEAGDRTSNMGTPSDSAEASTQTVPRLLQSYSVNMSSV